MQKRSEKHVWTSLISKLAVLGLVVGICTELALPQNATTSTALTVAGTAMQAQDPGVRGGAPGAGAPLPNLSSTYADFFTAALNRFQEVDSVSGTVPNEGGRGLGPRFNSNSCSSCHAFPAVGGTSPATNPQVAVATLDGAHNSLPSFITIDGPVREARFVHKPNGAADGGVHDLFVITGRLDAAACGISQPDFATELANHNVIFRIPTPIFGAGLIENIADDAILANAMNPAKLLAGISGRPNRNGNDGTITRFGWKAQNKSLMTFAGEAYNVEQGVTNEIFPNSRQTSAACDTNNHPEDTDDVVQFATFMSFLAPPTPAPSYGTVSAASIQ